MDQKQSSASKRVVTGLTVFRMSSKTYVAVIVKQDGNTVYVKDAFELLVIPTQTAEGLTMRVAPVFITPASDVVEGVFVPELKFDASCNQDVIAAYEQLTRKSSILLATGFAK